METEQVEKKESRLLMGALAVLMLAVIALSIIGSLCLRNPDDVVEGMADATSVRISGKLPGRVAELYVREGDMVKAGDTLVHIHSSLAEAKLMQAQGMETAAQALNSKVDDGTRPQIIEGAQDLVNQADAALSIAKKTYERMNNLAAEGVVSAQKRDEAKAAYDAAVAARAAAQSQLNLARAGAQRQDKQQSAAMVTVARGGIREVEAVLEDQYLVAPCDGQIDQIYPQTGELVSLGAPIMSLLKVDDKWVTFNVREEELNKLRLGQEIDIMIPALDKKKAKARIYYIRDLGSYATWHATKATGEWDSRTFEVKARPTNPIGDLRPGMTVLYDK